MKFVVLGAAGQLGHDLCPRLPGEVIPLTRAQADLTKQDALGAVITGHRPDIVINCAAYNFVDRAEAEPEAAMAVNAWGVNALAEICRDLGSTLVQFSTDQVFGLDAARQTPYSVQDAPGPVNVYGLTKLAGENVVRSIVPRHFVIRTCGLYGASGVGGKGGNFVETMLKLAGQNKPLRVVMDQHCTPSYTADIAQAVVELLKTQSYGIHHITNSGACTWFDFARTIFELAGLTPDLTPITSAQWQSAARRPAYSVLACDNPARPWQKALAAYIGERKR